MVWSKISFEELSPSSSASTQNSANGEVPTTIPSFVQAPKPANDEVRAMVESFVQAQENPNTSKENSSTQVPNIADEDKLSGGLPVPSKTDAAYDGCARKPDAVAISNVEDCKDASALEMGLCTISLADWCTANKLSSKFLIVLQELGADSVDDLFELSEGDRKDMVEETGLRFVEKKKLLKALGSFALNSYYDCVLGNRMMAEYKNQIEADFKRVSNMDAASGWQDDFDTKPTSKPAQPVFFKEEDLEIEGNFQGKADLDALEAQDGRETLVRPPLKKHLIQVPLVEENKRDGPWKTIVMIGETGTGKSTTINSMVNYLFGVQYEDPHRYVLIRDAHRDQSQSVTSEVTAYHIQPINGDIPFGVTLVDGPGFNDTSGLTRDEQIWKQYQKYFSEDLVELDAVCFTMRATCGRFTPSQRYVYGKILSLFGNDIKGNLFMLLTFCDGKTPPAMHAIKAAEFPCVGRCIKLNNSAFFNGFEGLLAGRDSNIVDEDGDTNLLGGIDVSEAFWKIGYRALEYFFAEALPRAPKTSLTLTREVLKEREQLEMIVAALNQRIREGLDTLECIRRTVDQVKSHQTDLDAHADFKIYVSKPKVEKIDLQGKGIHTTTCLTCNYTCHNMCRIPNNEDKAHCWAMTGGSCRICPAKCHWSDHSNLPFWFQHSTVRVQEVALSKKAAAEAAATGISNTEAILREQRDKYLKQKMEVMGDIMRVHCIINRLRKIALRKDMLDADDHFQAMIDSELSARRPGYRARVNAIRSVQEESKLLREFCDGHTVQRVESMDQALKSIDRDIKLVSEKYEQSIKRVHANGGKAKGWTFPWRNLFD